MSAPAIASTMTAPMTQGQTPSDDASSSGATGGVAVSVGVCTVCVGDALGVADVVGAGVGVEAPVTVKEYSPEIGCPSLETTFQSTVREPDASPASFCVTTVSLMTGAPSTSDEPEASVTAISFAPASVEMRPLKVSVISAGRASRVASDAGSLETSSSCALAGAATRTAAPKAARRPTMRAARPAPRRLEDRGE